MADLKDFLDSDTEDDSEHDDLDSVHHRKGKIDGAYEPKDIKNKLPSAETVLSSAVAMRVPDDDSYISSKPIAQVLPNSDEPVNCEKIVHSKLLVSESKINETKKLASKLNGTTKKKVESKIISSEHTKNVVGTKRLPKYDDRVKLNSKERVKRQRTKGQSGIGSDFRVWKSDLEMTLRQGFD